MRSLERLKDKSVRSMSNALTALKAMPADTNGRNSAIRTLQATQTSVGNIGLEAYIKARRAGANCGPVFFDPIDKAIENISGDTILNVPHDIERILAQQGVPQPDVNVLDAVADVQQNLKVAKRSLRLMRNSWLRFLMGPWAIVGIFAFAILYAALFFVFRGSEVPHPLTQQGATMIASKVSTSVTDLKLTVASADNVLDGTAKFVEQLTKLISKLPALIAAFGVLYASCRKLVVR